jgi:hypothetical protein
MAKKTARRRAKGGKSGQKPKSGARGRATKPANKPAGRKKAASAARKPARRSKTARKKADLAATQRSPRLDRERRTLEDDVVRTPPSSLNMERHGSAARTGRAEMAQSRKNHGQMGAVTTGDPDVNVDNAYFSGDEAPGGDNPTPDQDIVDDIGKALGVEYNDNEELRSGDKVRDRDKHRWELDPASAEDYKERR